MQQTEFEKYQIDMLSDMTKHYPNIVSTLGINIDNVLLIGVGLPFMLFGLVIGGIVFRYIWNGNRIDGAPLFAGLAVIVIASLGVSAHLLMITFMVAIGSVIVVGFILMTNGLNWFADRRARILGKDPSDSQ